MNFLLEYVKQKMLELGIKNYDTRVSLTEVAKESTSEISAENDYLFFANAFTNGSNPIDGYIIGNSMALVITPAINQTIFYKHQHYFTGKVKIKNNDTVDKMYVEFLIVTPVITHNDAR